jgi:hypothetical protein
VPISLSYHGGGRWRKETPPELVRSFRLEAEVDGAWRTIHTDERNYLRFLRLPFEGLHATAVRLTPEATHGSDEVRIFTFAVNEPDPERFA